MTVRIGAILLAVMTAVPGVASADIVYTYTGNPFAVGDPESATNLTFSFITTQALAPNTTYNVSTSGAVATGIWSMSDGPLTANCTGSICGAANPGNDAAVTTNASGQITSWDAQAYLPGGTSAFQYQLETQASNGNPVAGLNDIPIYDYYRDLATNNDAGTSTVGTWTASAVPVPLPATALLMMSGLGGLGVLVRRRLVT